MAYIILTQKVPPDNYRDEIGLSYSYPKRYWKRVNSGDRFIYHQPRTKGGGKVYFGCGVIGSITNDPQDDNLKNAELLDYTPFEVDVDVVTKAGFLEPEVQRPADLRGNSVRRVAKDVANLILLRSETDIPWYWDDTTSFPQEAVSPMDRKQHLRERLARFDAKYSNQPPRSRRLSLQQLNRPSSIANLVKELWGTTCAICETPGFDKQDGTKYAEVHHVEELSTRNLGVLGSNNMIVVCANCHRKLHYAQVAIEEHEDGWTIVINNETYFVESGGISS